MDDIINQVVYNSNQLLSWKIKQQFESECWIFDSNKLKAVRINIEGKKKGFNQTT